MLQDKLATTTNIPAFDVALEGGIVIPAHVNGLVLVTNGTGRARSSRRTQYLVEILHEHGLGTLAVDLLLPEEDPVVERHFDIPLLTRRLIDITRWLETIPSLRSLRIGYLAANTGAAAALDAARQLTGKVAAVAIRGGRPDLPVSTLHMVRTPTLLIVGEHDDSVLDINRRAHEELRAPKELFILPGAGRLFEEPGALDAVARIASEWFAYYFAKSTLA